MNFAPDMIAGSVPLTDGSFSIAETASPVIAGYVAGAGPVASAGRAGGSDQPPVALSCCVRSHATAFVMAARALSVCSSPAAPATQGSAKTADRAMTRTLRSMCDSLIKKLRWGAHPLLAGIVIPSRDERASDSYI